MVRGLIENQKLRPCPRDEGKRKPRFLATRERRNRRHGLFSPKTEAG